MKNKLILILFTLLALLVLTASCKKGSSSSKSNRKNTHELNEARWIVMANGGLNARETPDLEGKIAFLIPKFALVDPIEEVGETIEINNRTGKWTHINYGDKSGFVFGAYLTKSIVHYTKESPDNSYYYTFYSLPEPGQTEPTYCWNNFKQQGCLVVIYKSGTNQVVNSFTDTTAGEWIDSGKIETSWSIGDAGYGGNGVNAYDIHTKQTTPLWKMESTVKFDNINEKVSESICLKNTCFDLLKNPDLIEQIKSNSDFKYYKSGRYEIKEDVYKTEIKWKDDKTITFIPDENIVIE